MQGSFMVPVTSRRSWIIGFPRMWVMHAMVYGLKTKKLKWRIGQSRSFLCLCPRVAHVSLVRSFIVHLMFRTVYRLCRPWRFVYTIASMVWVRC